MGFIATNYRHHHLMGKKGLIRRALALGELHPPIPGVALPGKDIAFCLALLLMG
jgi:hypothetical protein